jgi:uroporphyrinogen-III decarboxylase
MVSRERVKIAMAGGTPDRVPVIPQICPPHAIRVAGLPYQETIVDRLEHPEKYDLLVPDCAAAYGVDGFRVWLGSAPQKIEWDGAVAYAVDPGSGERLGSVDFNGGGGVLTLPEKKRQLEEQDIEAIAVVPANQLMDGAAMGPARKAVKKYGDEYFIIGAPGQFTVETLCHEQGMEATLIDMLERPEFVRQWTERQLQASIQRAIAMARIGVDAFYIGETFGQFMSADIFEQLCLPYFQRFVAELRPYGPLIYLHMCGRVTHLLELMAATGVDCIEPLDEVAGTRVAEVAKRIGGHVALMGGVSTIVLARGSVEEVRQECRRCIREAGKNGGYILAACDMLPTETEPEKVRAMIEIACREGKYGSALPGTA